MKSFKSLSLFSDVREIPPILSQKVFPSLNGLRAVSILLVVFSHIQETFKVIIPNIAFIGPLGVDVFFVISGFLITTLCIKEKVVTGTLSLRKFYLRRFLRILPVAYLYIIVVAILNYFFKLDVAGNSFLVAALFLVDISFFFNRVKFDWNLAHYWSLSVEEQFYIMLPVFLKKQFKVFLAIVLFLTFGAPVLYFAQTFSAFLYRPAFVSGINFIAKFQGIAVGCLFSVMVFKGWLNFGRWRIWVTLLAIFAITVVHFDSGLNLMASSVNLFVSICIGFIVVGNLQYQNNLIYRFLNLRAMDLIGRLSYSIYIWQQLFLSNNPALPVSRYPLNIIALIVIPLVSYFGYERVFLRIRDRFRKIQAD